MANKKRAPRDIEDRHRAILSVAAKTLAEKREDAKRAELVLREKVRDAFTEGVTVGPIREATQLSTPRLYQIRHEELPETIAG
jgi:hypothetical protein